MVTMKWVNVCFHFLKGDIDYQNIVFQTKSIFSKYLQQC